MPGPEVRVERFETLAMRAGSHREMVRAWSLGELAAAIGIELDEHSVADLNGDQILRDPQLPLVTGDAVGFMVADRAS
jgi:molybdopterin-guanine dinucleotide biosynthesis protein A